MNFGPKKKIFFPKWGVGAYIIFFFFMAGEGEVGAGLLFQKNRKS